LIKTFPWSDFAAKSQYAIAWIKKKKKNDQQEAIVHYRQLAENFPKSNYASLVKIKLDTVEKYFPSKKSVDTAAVGSKPVDSVQTVPKQFPAKTTEPTIPVKIDSSQTKKPPSDNVIEDTKIIPPIQKPPQVDTIQTRRKRDMQ
jgi:hypothetical protein